MFTFLRFMLSTPLRRGVMDTIALLIILFLAFIQVEEDILRIAFTSMIYLAYSIYKVDFKGYFTQEIQQDA